MSDESLLIENTHRLLEYAIARKIAVDPQLVLDALTGKLTQADLGLPMLEGTGWPE
jgi:hypothetical protein